MKFTYKLFLAIIIIIAIAFSAGGYFLISSSFDVHLKSETDRALEENLLLKLAYEGAASTYIKEDVKLNRDIITSIAEQLDDGGSRLICVAHNDQNIIYSNLKTQPDYSLMSKSEKELAYRITQKDEKYYIYVCSYINVGQQPLFLQTVNNITSVFTAREEQLYNFVTIDILVVSASAVLTIIISLILTRPIKKLSLATRRIAQGKYSERVKIVSDDEIGSLTKDFNNMADTLEEQIDALKQSARQKDEFVASFAHELKTPLTSIIGYADMLRSKKLDAHKAFLASNYIFSEGKRLEALSFKLLELIVLNKQEFDKKRTNARLLISSVAQTVIPAIQEAGLELIYDAMDAIISVEPDLIKTLLINLIDNARKASNKGGAIELSGVVEGNDYIICIKDYGCGIPKKELIKITEAFYMVDKSRARAQNGAGLGLALCEAIVRIHSSELEFFSEENKGTIVRIKLQGAKEVDL